MLFAQQTTNKLSQFCRALRRVFDLIQLIGKTIEIINRLVFVILGRNRDSLGFPVGRKDNDRVRFQACSNLLKKLAI